MRVCVCASACPFFAIGALLSSVQLFSQLDISHGADKAKMKREMEDMSAAAAQVEAQRRELQDAVDELEARGLQLQRELHAAHQLRDAALRLEEENAKWVTGFIGCLTLASIIPAEVRCSKLKCLATHTWLHRNNSQQGCPLWRHSSSCLREVPPRQAVCNFILCAFLQLGAMSLRVYLSSAISGTWLCGAVNWNGTDADLEGVCMAQAMSGHGQGHGGACTPC